MMFPKHLVKKKKHRVGKIFFTEMCFFLFISNYIIKIISEITVKIVQRKTISLKEVCVHVKYCFKSMAYHTVVQLIRNGRVTCVHKLLNM